MFILSRCLSRCRVELIRRVVNFHPENLTQVPIKYEPTCPPIIRKWFQRLAIFFFARRYRRVLSIDRLALTCMHVCNRTDCLWGTCGVRAHLTGHTARSIVHAIDNPIDDSVVTNTKIMATAWPSCRRALVVVHVETRTCRYLNSRHLRS